VPSPVAPVVELSDVERSQLVAWSRRATSANALAMRSRIVLAAADGLTNTAIAAKLDIAIGSARRWRTRFVFERLDGLLDEPRPGRPRTVADEQVEAVITRTLETTPKNATHWSTRSLAVELGVSQSAVSRIWRAFGLAPHRQDSWKLSKDPQFIDKVRDVVGLYLDPPEAAVVLCVDEKSQIQALDRTAPIFPMMPGTPARATHDYKRAGTSSLYAALDIASGQVIGSLHPGTGRSNSRSSCRPSTRRCRPSMPCTSCSTTPPPTRPRRSNAGCSHTPASCCTSPQPAPPGSTSSSACSGN
jgi:transposase